MSSLRFSLQLLTVTATFLALAIFNPGIAAENITLRVLLYPYIPETQAAFFSLSQRFQERNLGMTIEAVGIDPNEDYYDQGLLKAQADIYEIDTILLSDMIALGKLAEINTSAASFYPQSIEAVTRDGKVYATPHWMCGNFLFYHKNDKDIANIQTWSDFSKTLQKRGGSLLVDFMGRSTLGEWYMTILSDSIGVDAAQAEVLTSSEPRPAVVDEMKEILSTCPTGMCRSSDLHNRTGYYSREFFRGAADTYIGYSETSYYGLQDRMDNCRVGTPCIGERDIAIRRLPGISGAAPPVGLGWVDGLAADASLSGDKKVAALKFIEYATSPEGYASILNPDYGAAPRYLLPARLNLDLSKAPLYPDFFAALVGRRTGSLLKLNARLRELSTKVNCDLPIDRTDTSTASKCAVN